jgi:hypothetical protein
MLLGVLAKNFKTKTLSVKLYLKNLLNGIGVFYVWLKNLLICIGVYCSFISKKLYF